MPPQEVIITKIQTPKTIFDLSAAESAHLSNTAMSANIVEATMVPKVVAPRRGSHDCVRKRGL